MIEVGFSLITHHFKKKSGIVAIGIKIKTPFQGVFRCIYPEWE